MSFIHEHISHRVDRIQAKSIRIEWDREKATECVIEIDGARFPHVAHLSINALGAVEIESYDPWPPKYIGPEYGAYPPVTHFPVEEAPDASETILSDSEHIRRANEAAEAQRNDPQLQELFARSEKDILDEIKGIEARRKFESLIADRVEYAGPNGADVVFEMSSGEKRYYGPPKKSGR